MEKNKATIIVEISPAELVDKITMLEIKKSVMNVRSKIEHLRYEYSRLINRMHEALFFLEGEKQKFYQLFDTLKSVNRELWKVEDDIRDCEREKNFGEHFVRLSRLIYTLKDQRAWLKQEINLLFGLTSMEENFCKEVR